MHYESDRRIARQGPISPWKSAAEVEHDRQQRERVERWHRDQNRQWPIGETPGQATPKRISQW